MAAVEEQNQPEIPKPASPKLCDVIVLLAANVSSQPLHNFDPLVWGVFTAISNNARKRKQGINIIFTAEEHCIGRVVDDVQFQLDAVAASGNHCKVYRKTVVCHSQDSSTCRTAVILKDTSTNGTYVNWKKFKKEEVEIRHGDIISFVAPPEHELALAFVYREVVASTANAEGSALKRKAEESNTGNKRQKGIGIGGPQGPLSLDDFRKLLKSNTELRKQVESQGVMIDKLQNENRAIIDRHENGIKEIKESISKSYLGQLKELEDLLELKQNELTEINKTSAEQKHLVEDLRERLSSSAQSHKEADEFINSQKASIVELKELLDEEREQRREEREKAVSDLKAAAQRAMSEAQEELKRSSEAALRREREQQEVINKLQESERERCALVETLRSKLEDAREKLVVSENRARQLETQVRDVQLSAESGKKRVEELELELQNFRQELDMEKAAREEAWAKVSSLELEMNAALRDLEFEKLRLKGARERIMLRETQLRAFYSTTEEISALFAKQQEQLKAMQRTLEAEENYENTSIDVDLNTNLPTPNTNVRRDRENDVTENLQNNAARTESTTSAQRRDKMQIEETSSDNASVTKKHDCGAGSVEAIENTQEMEFTSSVMECGAAKIGFGSDIDGIGTAPMTDIDGDGFPETEQVPETESPGIPDLNKSSAPYNVDTMQLDEEDREEEANHVRVQEDCPETSRDSPQKNDNRKGLDDDTEPGGMIRTADLLTSELAGSWACSTAPSAHGDNESPIDESLIPGTTLLESNLQVAESQSNPTSQATRKHDREALCEMIGIVAPELKENFGGGGGDDRCDEKSSAQSCSDTESISDNNEDGDEEEEEKRRESVSDAETEDNDRVDENGNTDHNIDDDEVTHKDLAG